MITASDQSGRCRAHATTLSSATSAEFETRPLSDQLSYYRVDDPYIPAHLHGPSSRLALDLDDSPIVLRTKRSQVLHICLSEVSRLSCLTN